MKQSSRIFVAGHRGLVGSAILRQLEAEGYKNIILRPRAELDLRDAVAVDRFFETERPEFVFLAAAQVGGILANSSAPADFLRNNLLIATSVIDSSWRHGVTKLLFLGSSCIYPKFADQPIQESSLLTGPLEPTNEWYALAKIAGIKLAQSYRRQYGFKAICLMPTNLYGPHDNFDLTSSHVLPALLRKFDEARRMNAPEVVVWGTGAPRREFLHVDDLGSATLHFMRAYDSEEIVNIGTGVDISIKDLTTLVREVTGFQGRVVFDSTKPDGTPRKLLDVSRAAALGWRAKISLALGIRQTYQWYNERVAIGLKEAVPGFRGQAQAAHLTSD